MNVKRNTSSLLFALFLAMTFLVLSALPVAAAEKADLDQYANKDTSWVKGNLGASKATYFEGDSVPYRLKLTGLTTGSSYKVEIEWATTKGGKHATDYLTTYNRTPTGADPCSDVTGCGSPSTKDIPADSHAPTGKQVPGVFTLYNGTITDVSAYNYTGTFPSGDAKSAITITFTAGNATPVLAWGGHISTRADWGMDSAAVDINGSAYHMWLVGLDGSGGQQDCSMSASALILPGSITIVKQATPEGSTGFPFTATSLSPANFNLVDDGTSANTRLFSNITNFQTYTITEGSVAGWSLNTTNPIVCSVTSPNGGTQTPNASTRSVAIDLREGENVTCTFNNHQQASTLTVIKHVVKDNGGTAVASNFTMNVSGTNVSSASFPGVESPGTTVTLSPGNYSVTESGGPSGYTASSIGCSGTIAAGESKTCTITNDDIAPQLTLKKEVVNDNGGSALPADFTLTATGPTNISGKTPVTSPATFKAGTYTLSETGPLSGYTGTWSCVGATLSGNNQITLGLSDNATCTITNNDIAPKLTVIKTVVNGTNGTAKASDFTMNVSGTKVSSASFPGVESPGTTVTLDAGNYSVTESGGPSGYTASSSGCSGTIAAGESKTCTITNVYGAAIIVKKVTDPNSDTTTSFTFTFTAGREQAPTTFSLTNGGTQTFPVAPGSGYSVAETVPAGWVQTNATCDNESAPGNITVGEAQVVTCTFNNRQQLGTLIVEKVVVNDNGGIKTASDFKFQINGGTATAFNPVVGNSIVQGRNTLTVPAGTYSVTEPAVTGYATSYSYNETTSCASVVVPDGGSATCTIKNDDQPGTLIVNKVVVNSAVGAKATDFSFVVDGGAAVHFEANGQDPLMGQKSLTVNAGTHSVTEPAVEGYTTTYSYGDSNSCASVVVPNGGSATCTITNTKGTAIIVKKVTVPSSNTTTSFAFTTGAGLTPATFNLTNGGTQAFSVTPGTVYSVAETALAGWTQTSATCDNGNAPSSITATVGQVVTCTFTNTQNAAPTPTPTSPPSNNGGGGETSDYRPWNTPTPVPPAPVVVIAPTAAPTLVVQVLPARSEPTAVPTAVPTVQPTVEPTAEVDVLPARSESMPAALPSAGDAADMDWMGLVLVGVLLAGAGFGFRKPRRKHM